ncbi:MAG TPA: tetratricopeptide repeat protein [bacterium]|nr:tetratricopeptide repeat protein [bacterium]
MSAQDPSQQYLAEGEECLAVEDWNGAIAAFQKAAAAAPSSAHAQSKLGVAYVHKQQWDEAQTSFLKAIQLDPRYAPAHSNLGNVYRERGRLDEAVACYQKAIAMDPDYWIAHQNLGIVYKQQKRVAEAVREFKTATKLSLRAGTKSYGPDVPRKRPERASRMGCLGSAGMTVLLLVAVAISARR